MLKTHLRIAIAFAVVLALSSTLATSQRLSTQPSRAIRRLDPYQVKKEYSGTESRTRRRLRRGRGAQSTSGYQPRTRFTDRGRSSKDSQPSQRGPSRPKNVVKQTFACYNYVVGYDKKELRQGTSPCQNTRTCYLYDKKYLVRRSATTTHACHDTAKCYRYNTKYKRLASRETYRTSCQNSRTCYKNQGSKVDAYIYVSLTDSCQDDQLQAPSSGYAPRVAIVKRASQVKGRSKKATRGGKNKIEKKGQEEEREVTLALSMDFSGDADDTAKLRSVLTLLSILCPLTCIVLLLVIGVNKLVQLYEKRKQEQEEKEVMEQSAMDHLALRQSVQESVEMSGVELDAIKPTFAFTSGAGHGSQEQPQCQSASSVVLETDGDAEEIKETQVWSPRGGYAKSK